MFVLRGAVLLTVPTADVIAIVRLLQIPPAL